MGRYAATHVVVGRRPRGAVRERCGGEQDTFDIEKPPGTGSGGSVSLRLLGLGIPSLNGYCSTR